jgi:RNA polymerase-binding transcription factor DksA
MPLTRRQRNELRTILELRYNTLLSEIEADRAKAATSMYQVAGERGETDEHLSAVQEAGIAGAEMHRDWQELDEVQQALARFDGGGYGICLGCGSEIPWKRMLGTPAATRCLECQAAFERALSPP